MLPDSPEKVSIEKLLSGPPGLACFDFDNTLIRGDLGEAVMYYILIQGLIAAETDSFWNELQHPAIPASSIDSWKRLWEIYRDQEDAFSYEKIAEGLLESYDAIAASAGLEAAYRWTRVIFAGTTEEELTKIARHVFEENQLPDIAPIRLGDRTVDASIRVRKPFQEIISRMLQSGWEVRVITASPECAIRHAARTAFAIPEENVRGMRLEIQDGVLLPRIIEPMTFDTGKVNALRGITSREIDFAAGDSFTDLAMLKAAKHTVLVDRGNEKLRAVGESSGWWILPAAVLDAV